MFIKKPTALSGQAVFGKEKMRSRNESSAVATTDSSRWRQTTLASFFKPKKEVAPPPPPPPSAATPCDDVQGSDIDPPTKALGLTTCALPLVNGSGSPSAVDTAARELFPLDHQCEPMFTEKSHRVSSSRSGDPLVAPSDSDVIPPIPPPTVPMRLVAHSCVANEMKIETVPSNLVNDEEEGICIGDLLQRANSSVSTTEKATLPPLQQRLAAQLPQKRPRATVQLQLDAGQTLVLMTECPECGLRYSSVAEDVALHKAKCRTLASARQTMARDALVHELFGAPAAASAVAGSGSGATTKMKRVAPARLPSKQSGDPQSVTATQKSLRLPATNGRRSEGNRRRGAALRTGLHSREPIAELMSTCAELVRTSTVGGTGASVEFVRRDPAEVASPAIALLPPSTECGASLRTWISQLSAFVLDCRGAPAWSRASPALVHALMQRVGLERTMRRLGECHRLRCAELCANAVGEQRSVHGNRHNDASMLLPEECAADGELIVVLCDGASGEGVLSVVGRPTFREHRPDDVEGRRFVTRCDVNHIWVIDSARLSALIGGSATTNTTAAGGGVLTKGTSSTGALGPKVCAGAAVVTQPFQRNQLLFEHLLTKTPSASFFQAAPRPRQEIKVTPPSGTTAGVRGVALARLALLDAGLSLLGRRVVYGCNLSWTKSDLSFLTTLLLDDTSSALGMETTLVGDDGRRRCLVREMFDTFGSQLPILTHEDPELLECALEEGDALDEGAEERDFYVSRGGESEGSCCTASDTASSLSTSASRNSLFSSP